MIHWFAYAERTDLFGGESSIVLWDLGIVVAAGVLMLVPLALPRRHRQAILAITVLWALLTAVSTIIAVNAQFYWAAERLNRIKTGYYDPTDTTGAPAWPWAWWGLLAGVYALLLVYPLRPWRRRNP